MRLFVFMSLALGGCASTGPSSFECVMMDHTCNDPDSGDGFHPFARGWSEGSVQSAMTEAARAERHDQAIARCDASVRDVLVEYCQLRDEAACVCLGRLEAVR